MSYYTDAQRNALDNLSPGLRALGLLLGTELELVRTLLASGNLGITADAADVDSLAKGGGVFSLNSATTSGLTLGYQAGRFSNGLALVSVPAGMILLSASATNYVEVDRTGTVTSNTSGFTSGRLPLWTVTTGVSSISVVTSVKPLLTLIGTAGVVGSMLSTIGKTKEEHLNLGDISATASFTLIVPGNAGTVAKLAFVTKTAITQSDTNYWTFGVVNKGAAGAGTTAVVDNANAANSTKSTGGSAIAAYTPRNLTLNGTPGVDAALDFAAGDVLEVTITKTASATTMQQCALRFDSTFTG